MQEIDPKGTNRAYAFEMWMDAPMPMVTFFKTLQVSHLLRISRKTGMKFNMLMCWCIGKAASGMNPNRSLDTPGLFSVRKMRLSGILPASVRILLLAPSARREACCMTQAGNLPKV